MATVEEVKKLAALVRITIDDADLEKFTSEFDAILGYIGQLEKLEVQANTSKDVPSLRNVMRMDGAPHPTGEHAEKLAEQFPSREGNALSVKQILTHD